METRQNGFIGVAIGMLARKGKVMTIITIGIDLAKNIFAVHGVNEGGRADPMPLT